MSVSVSSELVNWDNFREACQQHQDKRFYWEKVEAFEEAMDNGEDMDAYFAQEENWVQPAVGFADSPEWANSWDTAVECEYLQEKMSPVLQPSTRQLFDTFCDGIWGAHSVQDIENVGMGSLFSIVFSPDSVQKYLDIGNSLPFDELETAFNHAIGEGALNHFSDGYVKSFDDFRMYLLNWIGLLQEAHTKKAGLVIEVA